MVSSRHDWFGVLAGRYATEAAMKKHVAHLVPLDEEGHIDWNAKTLCKKLPAERMSDMPADLSTPRCPTCLERSMKTKKRTTKKRSKSKRSIKRRALSRLRRVMGQRRGYGVLRLRPVLRPEAHVRHKGVMIDTSFNPDGTVDYYVVEGSRGRFYSLAVAKEIAEGMAARHPKRFR